MPRKAEQLKSAEPLRMGPREIDQPGGRSPRRSRNHERTRQAILENAFQLYARDGYAAVSMRVLAQALGCSAPSLYNYFLSKEEIFDTLRDRGFDRFEALIRESSSDDPLDDLRSFFLRYYKFSITERTYFTLLWVDPVTADIAATGPRLQAIAEVNRAKVARCISAGIFPVGTSIKDLLRLAWIAVHGAGVLLNLRGNTIEPLDQLVARAVDLVFDAARRGDLVTETSLAP
jgi:AcrR family transcriptional regulator